MTLEKYNYIKKFSQSCLTLFLQQAYFSACSYHFAQFKEHNNRFPSKHLYFLGQLMSSSPFCKVTFNYHRSSWFLLISPCTLLFKYPFFKALQFTTIKVILASHYQAVHFFLSRTMISYINVFKLFNDIVQVPLLSYTDNVTCCHLHNVVQSFKTHKKDVLYGVVYVRAQCFITFSRPRLQVPIKSGNCKLGHKMQSPITPS